MRQETGSSNLSNIERSIQLRLDGDSFSLEQCKELAIKCKAGDESSFADNPIHLLSHRSVLVPFSEFESKGAEALLRECGVVMSQCDSVVSLVRGERVALIALPTTIHKQLLETFGEDAPFTSPLLRTSICETGHIILYCAEGLTYINVYSAESMIFAEVFLSPSLSDTLYWLSRIGEGVDLDDYTIYLTSSKVELVKLLRKYYKNVEICE